MEKSSIIELAFCHYLVTPLYTEAPLENPLLFSSLILCLLSFWCCASFFLFFTGSLPNQTFLSLYPCFFCSHVCNNFEIKSFWTCEMKKKTRKGNNLIESYNLRLGLLINHWSLPFGLVFGCNVRNGTPNYK